MTMGQKKTTLLIEYDEEGAKMICGLLNQVLEDRWLAEQAPPEPLFRGERIYIVKQPCAGLR